MYTHITWKATFSGKISCFFLVLVNPISFRGEIPTTSP